MVRPLREVVLALLFTGLQSAMPACADNTNHFDQIAEILLQGIDANWQSRADPIAGKSGAIGYLAEAYGYVQGKKPRIAVWPFRAEEVPISKVRADEFNDELEAALLHRSSGRHSFIARNEIRALIADMQQTGALDAASGNPIAALMKNARNIDILVIGKIRYHGTDLILSYSATRVDSTLMAKTRPIRIKFERVDVTRLRLDEAVRLAATRFADAVPDMQELRLGGVRYQTSGAQPQFGRYLQNRMTTALQDAFARALTDRHLHVLQPEMPRAITRGLRGAELGARELDSENFTKRSGSYLLSGTYWEFDDAVEIRLALANADGETASWTGRVRKDSLGGMALQPSKNLEGLKDGDNLGVIAFQLTSTRGRDPAYEIGEYMDLVLRVDRDAWVYCFYHQADGSTIQVFPNPHFWTHFDAPKLAGGEANVMPGEDARKFPFRFKMKPPTGIEVMKCFAASADITDLLPKELQGRSFEPLPPHLPPQIVALIFRQQPRAVVTSASLTVTVSER